MSYQDALEKLRLEAELVKKKMDEISDRIKFAENMVRGKGVVWDHELHCPLIGEDAFLRWDHIIDRMVFCIGEYKSPVIETKFRIRQAIAEHYLIPFMYEMAGEMNRRTAC